MRQVEWRKGGESAQQGQNTTKEAWIVETNEDEDLKEMFVNGREAFLHVNSSASSLTPGGRCVRGMSLQRHLA